MNDLDRHSNRPSHRVRLLIGILALVALLSGTATAVSASTGVRSSIDMGGQAKPAFGVVVAGARARSRLQKSLGVERRHLAHQRRPAFVAAAITAVQTEIAAAEAGLIPVVAAAPPAAPVSTDPDPGFVTPVEAAPSPEQEVTPPSTQPGEPLPPAEPPASEPPVEEPPAAEPPASEPPVEEPPASESPSVEEPAPEEPVVQEEPLLEAGFEDGLDGWSTAGVGEATPKVATDIVRDGSKASKVQLTGEQDRSELIFGGNGGGSTSEVVEFHEGDEYWYGFSVYVQSMVYGHPGAHNIFMQFKSNGEGSPNFALQLWDYAGDGGVGGGKGLWSAGDAMGGDRFLSPLSEDTWHDIRIHFKASSQNAGFYELYLDGRLVDSRENVSMILPGHSSAYIKDGLYRNGEEIPGTSDIRLDAAKLGESMESVLP